MNNRKVINISHCNSYLHFLCWLKESLRQASKKELVHFFEREQTSPKVTEAKERALCGGGKKSFPSRRPAGGTTQSTMQANAEAKRAWTMLSCEEKKMRSILTYSIVLSPQPCYGKRIFSFTPHVAFTSLQPTIANSDIFYYHTNHLGSTAFVTDQSQNVTQGFLYAPFGEITTEYNSTFGNDIIPKYSFNAKELDEETGMYYYEARYYKPPVFTSRDPMFEKYFWMTPYAYCANNPVKYVDPDGRDVVILIAPAGAGGKGHMAALIQDKNGNWYYMTMGVPNEDYSVFKAVSIGVQGNMIIKSCNTSDLSAALEYAKKDDNNSEYTQYLRFETSSSMDERVFESANEKADNINYGFEKYKALTNSCLDAVKDVLESGIGIKLPSKITPTPNAYFNKLKKNEQEIQEQINNKMNNETEEIDKDHNS